MSSILILVGGFFSAIVVGEIVLGGRKLQTGVLRLVVVHGVFWAAAVMYLYICRQVSVVAVSAFWAGGFLSWFVVRSHIESSILLGMVMIMREGPLSNAEILSRYESVQGLKHRTDELVNAGLVEKLDGDKLTITRKGQVVMAVYRFLGGGKDTN